MTPVRTFWAESNTSTRSGSPLTLQKIEVRKSRKAGLNVARTRAAKAKAQEDCTAAEKEWHSKKRMAQDRATCTWLLRS